MIFIQLFLHSPCQLTIVFVYTNEPNNSHITTETELMSNNNNNYKKTAQALQINTFVSSMIILFWLIPFNEYTSEHTYTHSM